MNKQQLIDSLDQLSQEIADAARDLDRVPEWQLEAAQEYHDQLVSEYELLENELSIIEEAE